MSETIGQYITRLRTGGSNQFEAAEHLERLTAELAAAKAKHYEECAVICDAIGERMNVTKDSEDYTVGIERGTEKCADEIRAAITDKPAKE